MKERLARALMIAIGGSFIINGIKGICMAFYNKGQVDAYKEVSRDLTQILKRHKKEKQEDKESE